MSCASKAALEHNRFLFAGCRIYGIFDSFHGFQIFIHSFVSCYNLHVLSSLFWSCISGGRKRITRRATVNAKPRLSPRLLAPVRLNVERTLDAKNAARCNLYFATFLLLSVIGVFSP